MRKFEEHADLVKKVTMYLDNELNEDDERNLLSELQQNPSCYNLLKQEQSFREFIKSKVHRRKVSPALIESIKEKIRVAPPYSPM